MDYNGTLELDGYTVGFGAKGAVEVCAPDQEGAARKLGDGGVMEGRRMCCGSMEFPLTVIQSHPPWKETTEKRSYRNLYTCKKVLGSNHSLQSF